VSFTFVLGLKSLSSSQPYHSSTKLESPKDCNPDGFLIGQAYDLPQHHYETPKHQKKKASQTLAIEI
jgi:hypothetical protein